MLNQTVKSNIPKTTIHAIPVRIGSVKGTSGYPAHRHDELEFLLIYEGVYCCTVSEKEYIGRAGDVIFIYRNSNKST